jgi:hypothetical protein
LDVPPPVNPPASSSGNVGNGTCNASCPVDCNLSGSIASPGGSSPVTEVLPAGTSSGNDWLGNSLSNQYNYKGDAANSSISIAGTSGSGIFTKGGVNRNNTVYEVITTNVPNKYPDSQELNTYIKKNIIDKWFDTESDPERPLPSKYAQTMFSTYTQGKSPIDRNHKNKLRDLVYYYMENIIPGLPTKDKPSSYVEWRPLRFLSNSNL